MLKPVLDATEAQWIIHGLDRPPLVSGFVPTGFDRHARILHPGWQIKKDTKRPVRWADMAKHTGRPFHRLSHWPEVSGVPRTDDDRISQIVSGGGVVIDYPDEGKLPEIVAKPLRDILAKHVSPDESCWFGVWVGFGCDYKPEIPITSSIDTRFREWHLFKGPIAAIGFQFFLQQDYTANIIWPDGRTWFVSTDIDLDTTYVGGSIKLIDELLNAKDLEAVEAHRDDYVTPIDHTAYNSDSYPTRSTLERYGEEASAQGCWAGRSGWRAWIDRWITGRYFAGPRATRRMRFGLRKPKHED